MIKKIAIIGAGLAGCSLAYELSKSDNFDITVFDKNSQVANEASGNFAGILAPYLTSDYNFSDQFHTAGYQLLLSFINDHKDEIDICNQGVIQILNDQKNQQKYEKIFNKRVIDPNLAQLLSEKEVAELTNNSISNKVVYYPNALSLVPSSICQLWLRLSNAKLSLNSKLIDINKDSDNLWNLEFKQARVIPDSDPESFNCKLNGEILNQACAELDSCIQDDRTVKNNNKSQKFDIVIFAGGYELFRNIDYLKKIPVYPSQGQLTVIDKGFDIDKTIMDKGYIIPNYKEDLQVIGATFRDNTDTDGDIRKTDDMFNISQIKETLSDNSKEIAGIDSRVATRCVTSDHLPLIGRLVEYNKFEDDFYKPLSKGYPKSKMPQMEYESGLYLTSGFGSKGLCSSLIAAKIISSSILNQTVEFDGKLLKVLSPQRFWVRSFKKGTKL